MTEKANGESQHPEIAIQRIYVKDLSIELPHAPEIFKEQWKTEVHLDIGDENTKIEDDTYEVTLSLTVKATMSDSKNVAFLIQVKQAGLFILRNISDENMGVVLGAFCPATLYPYARQIIASHVADAGFPPLHLAPINFDAIYAQKQKAANEGGK